MQQQSDRRKMWLVVAIVAVIAAGLVAVAAGTRLG